MRFCFFRKINCLYVRELLSKGVLVKQRGSLRRVLVHLFFLLTFFGLFTTAIFTTLVLIERGLL